MRQLPLPIALGRSESVEPETLADLLPPSLARTIRSTFDRVDIAEEEIAAAKRRFPLCASAIHGAFALLCPTDLIRDLSDDVFRYHCKEILERVANGQDVRPGTTAELLGFLSNASQTAPPTRVSALLYQELFSRLYPSGPSGSWRGVVMPELESFERGEMQSLEALLRMELATERDAA